MSASSVASPPPSSFGRLRWLALMVLCLGDLMIVLDSTIVNVALPSIGTSLGFSQASLAWVVNAYMLTFGGFLLLGGRLGDLFGPRRLFLWGIGLFTLASFACGLSTEPWMLMVARAIQGLGGAVVSAVALSLLITLFPQENERARAMGIFGFVMAWGGSVGVFLGGFLTAWLTWHWIFLVNIPIGILVAVLARSFLAADHPPASRPHLDFLGAATITLALMLAVYGIAYGNESGWTSVTTLGTLLSSVVFFVAFLWVESTARHPLVPLSLFSKPNIALVNGIAVLWAAAMFAWFFISALYMQLVLQYSPLSVGLSFLPANIIMAIFSIGLSARVVARFGIRSSMALGLGVASVGLFLFALAPVDGTFIKNILPSMLLIGFGAGMAFNPMLLAAMNGVPEDESGLASGVVNTAFMMGGALGLAILASLAAFYTAHMQAAGTSSAVALNAGYHVAFAMGGAFALLAAVLSALFIRISSSAGSISAPIGH